jgi:hypothetical protein
VRRPPRCVIGKKELSWKRRRRRRESICVDLAGRRRRPKRWRVFSFFFLPFLFSLSS